MSLFFNLIPACVINKQYSHSHCKAGVWAFRTPSNSASNSYQIIIITTNNLLSGLHRLRSSHRVTVHPRHLCSFIQPSDELNTELPRDDRVKSGFDYVSTCQGEIKAR